MLKNKANSTKNRKTQLAHSVVQRSYFTFESAADHVHMMIAIPPKYAVSNVVRYIKGKSAIHLTRVYSERKINFAGQSFWARGYFVSTVGRDEELIRNYIREQQREDERLDQLMLWR